MSKQQNWAIYSTEETPPTALDQAYAARKAFFELYQQHRDGVYRTWTNVDGFSGAVIWVGETLHKEQKVV